MLCLLEWTQAVQQPRVYNGIVLLSTHIHHPRSLAVLFNGFCNVRSAVFFIAHDYLKQFFVFCSVVFFCFLF